jgi:hypothetical protein
VVEMEVEMEVEVEMDVVVDRCELMGYLGDYTDFSDSQRCQLTIYSLILVNITKG